LFLLLIYLASSKRLEPPFGMKIVEKVVTRGLQILAFFSSCAVSWNEFHI